MYELLLLTVNFTTTTTLLEMECNSLQKYGRVTTINIIIIIIVTIFVAAAQTLLGNCYCLRGMV